MSPADHKLALSSGSDEEAEAYRAQQQKLLNEGKLAKAIHMDIDDIGSKFGVKYDDGIKQMLDYAETLSPSDFKK